MSSLDTLIRKDNVMTVKSVVFSRQSWNVVSGIGIVLIPATVWTVSKDFNTGFFLALAGLSIFGIGISGVDSDPESADSMTGFCIKAVKFSMKLAFVSSLAAVLRLQLHF